MQSSPVQRETERYEKGKKMRDIQVLQDYRLPDLATLKGNVLSIDQKWQDAGWGKPVLPPWKPSEYFLKVRVNFQGNEVEYAKLLLLNLN